MLDQQMQAPKLKGLEVAQRFFDAWGLAYLRAEFPEISERAACFLCGGSQSLGNDDDLSRDHGWGPMFTILLTGQDHKRYGQKLHRAINAAAPKAWLGYRFRASKINIKVDSLDKWFRVMIGCAQAPQTSKGWIRHTREDTLYMLRHATVFHDPLGEFGVRQNAFWFYPRDVWLHRLGLEVFEVWHYGQYNFLTRLKHRNDPIAIAICLGHFIQATMKICMLLNEDYTPYWKWLAAEFRKLPNVVDLENWLSELSTCSDLNRQVELVEMICKDLYARLVQKGLVGANPKGHPHPLLCARKALAEASGLA